MPTDRSGAGEAVTYDDDMARPAPRVLTIEDDDAVRDAVRSALHHEGYEVCAAPDGTRLRALVDTFGPDLAVLDVRLPHGPSGLSIAWMLREHAEIPILFLTAADAVDDRLAGFEAGADDYLVKPFVMVEFLARIRALLRRSGRLTSEVFQVADVLIDEAARRARRAGEPLDLTRTEFDLLVALSRRPGRVLSKPQLLTAVWGFDAYDANLVEVHVSALRRKLEAYGPRLIHTRRGLGYILDPP